MEISNSIVCRPALPMDTPGMIELTKHIWDGEDYVPGAWGDWLADREGILAVAESNAKVVGLGKLTKLSPVDWWLEGLRVHPKYEGRGIASRLHDYLLGYWKRNGSGHVRLATISKREPVKHMVKKRGFSLIGEFATYKVSFSDIEISNQAESYFELVKTEEQDKALSWLSSPGVDRLNFGIMDLGWQFAPPRIEFIEKYVNSEKLWWWRSQQGMLVLVTKSDGEDFWARIRLLACDRQDYLDCLRDALALAEQLGYEGVTWKAPSHSWIRKALAQVGFTPEEEYTLQIYEKSHPVVVLGN